MTTTRIYRSTDSSAPVLVGGVSSLINLLDKCLVDGYGAKTAAGWTKPFTGTDKACFRNSVAAGGTGMYLRVVDAAGGTGGAREALCRAYLTMSDVDTGTIETPTAAQVAASIVWRKSNTVDATARPWILVADELTFYLCIDTGTAASEGGTGTYGAGDIASYVPADPYRFFIAGRETQHGAGAQGSAVASLLSHTGTMCATPTSVGFWLARGYAGTGDPIRAGLAKLASGASSAPVGTVLNSLANPNPGTGLVYWLPAIIGLESAIRGVMRGLYVPQNSHRGVAMGTDVVNPPGLTATLTTLRHCSDTTGFNDNSDGHIHVDYTSAWPL